jgi:hypothetical protein
VLTDHGGLGTPGPHTYAVGQPEGHAALDAARAAARVPGSGLFPACPDVLSDSILNGLGRATVPVWLHHGSAGELIPLAVGEQLRTRWCALGATVQWRQIPLAEHILGVSGGGPAATAWLGQRFAGHPAAGNCRDARG